MTRQRWASSWLDWFGTGLVGAFAISLAEVAFTSMTFDAATSSIGIALAAVHAFALFGLYVALLATAAAFLPRVVVRRASRRRAHWLWANVLALLIVVPVVIAAGFFQDSAWEFPREMRWLGYVALFLLQGAAFLLARSYPALDRLARRLPWKARRGAVATSFFLLSVVGVAVAHFVIAPENLQLDKRSAVVGVACLAGAMFAVGAGVGRVPRRQSVSLAAVWILSALATLIPGAARDRARFLLWNHFALAPPMAELLRDRVDRDGDGAAPVWLGGTDCAEGDATRGPLRREVPGDGVDQDCRGGDAPLAQPAEAIHHVPECLAVDRPNVVLLTIDALRADAVTPELLPAVTELGRHGWRFEKAYSASALTSTSLPAINAGRPVSDIGAANPLKDDALDAPFTLGERFASAGYRTGAASSFDLHRLAIRGFEPLVSPWVDPSPNGAKEDLTSGSLTRLGLDWIGAPSDKPFFLWLHYSDVHARYKLTRDENGGLVSLRTAYDRGVSYVGARINMMLVQLKERGLLERTIIVISADHGEELLARGRQGHGPNLFDESIHVPLVMFVPGCSPRKETRPVSLAQLAPTLGALAKVDVPGRDLFETSDDLPIVSEAMTGFDGSYKRAIMSRSFKLIVDVPNGGRMLFDLAGDPTESTDILSARPDVADDLEQHYQRWLDSPGRR